MFRLLGIGINLRKSTRKPRTWRRRAVCRATIGMLLTLIGLLPSGCKSKANNPLTIRVQGKVDYEGQPLKSGSIQFVPVDPDARRPARGTIGPDGRFVMSTFEAGDGVQPGEYLVSVVAFRGDPESTTIKDSTENLELVMSPAIPQRYFDASKSQLRATISEKGGSQVLAFALTGKAPELAEGAVMPDMRPAPDLPPPAADDGLQVVIDAGLVLGCVGLTGLLVLGGVKVARRRKLRPAVAAAAKPAASPEPVATPEPAETSINLQPEREYTVYASPSLRGLTSDSDESTDEDTEESQGSDAIAPRPDDDFFAEFVTGTVTPQSAGGLASAAAMVSDDASQEVERPASNTANESRLTDGEPADRMLADDARTDEQPADESDRDESDRDESDDTEQTDEKPEDGLSASAASSDGTPVEQGLTGEEPADEAIADDAEQADEKLAGGLAAGAASSDGTPVEQDRAGEEPADESIADDAEVPTQVGERPAEEPASEPALSDETPADMKPTSGESDDAAADQDDDQSDDKEEDAPEGESKEEDLLIQTTAFGKVHKTPREEFALERRVAEWALNAAGTVHLQVTRTRAVEVGHLDDLPSTPFHVLEISFAKSDQPISDEDLELVAELGHLQTLDLAGTPVTDAGLAHLSNLESLTGLSLAETAITDRGLEHLAGTVRLRVLRLPQTKITDAGLEFVGQLTRLETLELKGTSVSDAGLAHLAGLDRLTFLDLTQTAVGDAGLEHLNGLFRLARLALSQTRVTDAGLVHLSRLNALTVLLLFKTAVTDAGLAQLRKLKLLTTLELKSTRITDAGLESLTRLAHLRQLFLGDTAVTDEGLQRLAAALPDCKIKR